MNKNMPVAGLAFLLLNFIAGQYRSAL